MRCELIINNNHLYFSDSLAKLILCSWTFCRWGSFDYNGYISSKSIIVVGWEE